ncbi:MAG: acetylglutamate kinase [Chloroflexi bacterium]|nr:acetylglutamate kinase [Chloroflexota bacterium]
MVVKIGGSTFTPDSPEAARRGQLDTSLEDVVALHREGMRPVVVHGGGKDITAWQERLGLSAQFERGLRVTDRGGLEVAVAVLAGLVNKELVAALTALGGRALGLSGADGGLIRGRIKDPALGYVGEIVSVDPTPLSLAWDMGCIPVVAPLGLGEGTLLNINADTAAGEIALALGAPLLFLTDVPGVIDDKGEVMGRLTAAEARRLITSGVISQGMIPKVEACLRAAEGGTYAQIVNGGKPHVLIRALEGRMVGTKVVRG